MATPPLGWIPPRDRTHAQHDAHDAAVKTFLPRHSLPPVRLAPGEKIILTKAWAHPTVVKDVGFEFNGFHQLTGSCVGVSEGNWITTLSALQRLLAVNPTMAFVCFWPFPYGRTRYTEGDRGQGQGAVDSVMGEIIANEGFFDINQPGLPTFDKSDGLILPEKTELAWSDGGSTLVTKWMEVAKKHVGAKAICNSTEDVWNAVGNGYPNINGCDYYIGNGSIRGSGDNAYVAGRYDGRGGHSTCILGIWQHPNDGRLFLYSNQWPTSTYPKDPAGGGRCCVWMPESELAKGFSSYGQAGGESLVLSHVEWFPANPDVPAVLSYDQF